MSEETIIRKLIADGNGSNEDRRLLSLFTSIHALEDNPNDLATRSKIEIALSQAELTFSKHLIVADTCIKGSEEIREFMSTVGEFLISLDLCFKLAKSMFRERHFKTPATNRRSQGRVGRG